MVDVNGDTIEECIHCPSELRDCRHRGDKILAFRYAGIVMCAIFLLGLVVLPFAPETKGKPLPE